MKKVILILVLFIGFNTIAQKREIKEINPEQFATLSTKRMTLDLDLNESQQTKIYQLNLENANARKSKMEAHKKAMENGETKKMTSDDRFVMQNKMLDHQIAQKKKMKSILTNEQFEKWEKMSKKRMGMYERKRGEKIEVDRMHKMKKENK
tara:strand:- start:19007 stop:19459 length:453 start_codon:yes stop_codon:yes gene_type:complete